jgi:hypothetical protein
MEQGLGTNLEGTACMERYLYRCKDTKRVGGVGQAIIAHPPIGREGGGEILFSIMKYISVFHHVCLVFSPEDY